MATDDVIAEELEHDKGKTLLLKLRDGNSIRGKLEDADKHMNITLSGAEEISADDKIRPLGTVLVRGDNIIIFSPS
jgi:small nuclear ribonucleoprotein